MDKEKYFEGCVHGYMLNTPCPYCRITALEAENEGLIKVVYEISRDVLEAKAASKREAAEEIIEIVRNTTCRTGNSLADYDANIISAVNEYIKEGE